jgi:hypothetical protein
VAGTTPGKAECPPPTIEGSYEHFEVTAVVPNPAGLELKGARSYPIANLPSDWPATCAPKRVAAAQEAVTEIVPVPSPMLLVMPAGASPNPNLTVAADRKSFTMKGQAWSWTYTPTLVR